MTFCWAINNSLLQMRFWCRSIVGREKKSRWQPASWRRVNYTANCRWAVGRKNKDCRLGSKQKSQKRCRNRLAPSSGPNGRQKKGEYKKKLLNFHERMVGRTRGGRGCHCWKKDHHREISSPTHTQKDHLAQEITPPSAPADPSMRWHKTTGHQLVVVRKN